MQTALTTHGESGMVGVITSIAGHVSRAMLSRYSHIWMEAKGRASDKIAARQHATSEKWKVGTERQQQTTAVSQISGCSAKSSAELPCIQLSSRFEIG
jgi:hypothetical protein